VTSATTRPYAPQQTANPYDAPYQSQLAQGFQFEKQAPDTARLYNPPMAHNYPDYPTNYQPSERKKSGALKWILITLLCVALVSGGISAIVISAMRAKQRSAQILTPSVEELEAQIREQIQREVERAKEEAVRAAEEARRAAQETGAPAPPAPPHASGELPAGLERYKYPNAEVKTTGGILGSEFVKMITNDSVSKVGDFYKKQLGDQILKNKDEDGESVIFQVSGSPSIMIIINQDDEDRDKTQIIIFRSSFQFPKIN
jgi:outer membrane murein-binding lipoprotein Lpp